MAARSKGGTQEGPCLFGVRARPPPRQTPVGIIASAARGMEGGRRELGPRPPPTPPPSIRPATATATAINIPQSRSTPGGQPRGARVRGRSAGGTALIRGQVAHSGRRGPGAAYLSHGPVSEPCLPSCLSSSKVFIYSPCYVLDPVPGWSNSPSPVLREAS